MHPDATFVWADITGSEAELRRIFEKHQVEYVFNYAAEPYIPVSFERPLHVFDVNARGALMAMNAAHESGCKGFLQVSSAEIYGKVDGKIKENDNATPHSTYGASKLAIDALVQSRWKEAGVKAIAMRQFNCLGERETHEYVVPVIIEQIAREIEKADGPNAPTVTIRLGNNSFRDFQYAGDAVCMAVELLEKGEWGEVYNMGSEEGIEMYDLAALIGGIMGVGVHVEPDEARMRPWEIWHLQSDNSKLYATIEARPSVSLRQALGYCVKDYRANGWAYRA